MFSLQCNVEFGYKLRTCFQTEESQGKPVIRRERTEMRKWGGGSTYILGGDNFLSCSEGSQAMLARPSVIGTFKRW
jgi:hypothetical protein